MQIKICTLKQSEHVILTFQSSGNIVNLNIRKMQIHPFSSFWYLCPAWGWNNNAIKKSPDKDNERIFYRIMKLPFNFRAKLPPHKSQKT